MKIITLDHGNSNPHLGVFENEKLSKVIPLHEYSPSPSDKIILTSVKKDLPFPVHFNLKNYRIGNLFFDMPIHYSNGLGLDRIVTAFYAFKEIKEEVLVIDAGTFITIDRVSSKSGFLGGNIFPGVKTFLKSYKEGELLPLVDFNYIETIFNANSTEDAINVAANIYLKNILKESISINKIERVYITGGDALLIEKIIKSFNLEIELLIMPHLIHLAMFQIHQNYLR